LLPFWELGKIDRFIMSLFSTIITKEIFERNVTLTSFVGRIITVAECTALVLEEECDDLVGGASVC
jgi:hypothetical protein